MNKKHDDQNSGQYFFNRIIIIAVFVAFAGTAFYLAFQEPTYSDFRVDSNANLDEHIWKKYRDKEMHHANVTASSQKIDDDKCYTARYLNQVESFNQIKVAFLEGHKFFGQLDKMRTQAKNDMTLLTVTDKLQKTLEDNELYMLGTLQNRFKTMRKEISRQMYINRAEHSFLLRSIARIIVIEKIGQNALNDGGINAAMERASKCLNVGAVKEAYDEINNNFTPDYRPMAQSWLELTKTYIDTDNAVNELGQYIHSQTYMKKFYKECR